MVPYAYSPSALFTTSFRQQMSLGLCTSLGRVSAIAVGIPATVRESAAEPLIRFSMQGRSSASLVSHQVVNRSGILRVLYQVCYHRQRTSPAISAHCQRPQA